MRSFINLLIAISCVLIFGVVIPSAHAAGKLPVPRFVSIKFNKANARTGPCADCPIEWVFIKKGEPVQVIAEYEHWRKILDITGQGGWVHSSVISGQRTVVVIGEFVTTPLLAKITDPASIVAFIEPGVRCKLKKCTENWCRVTCQKQEGYLPRDLLWGV